MRSRDPSIIAPPSVRSYFCYLFELGRRLKAHVDGNLFGGVGERDRPQGQGPGLKLSGFRGNQVFSIFSGDLASVMRKMRILLSQTKYDCRLMFFLFRVN